MNADAIVGLMKEQAIAAVKAEGYGIDEYGIITDPGKFEAESWYAPIVYSWMLDGSFGEELADGTCMYELSDTERGTFGFDSDVYGVSLYVSEQGFVYVTPLNADEWYLAINESEEAEEDFIVG